MHVVALVSGGKDSCYAMMKCQEYGHQIVALANLIPVDDAQDELDSYMYQTVGHQLVVSYSQCMGIPLFRRRIQGSSRHQSLNYDRTNGDEVEDMLVLLQEIKRQQPSVSAVSSGAIASDYQRLRVESVCSRLGLISLAYLWKQDQSSLLEQMVQNGIVAITVKVAALGLKPSLHLGKELTYLESHLHKLKELYGINVCGEGGEYETLTLDCPLFKNARIVLDKFEVILHSPDQIAPVGVLHPLEYHLEKKMGSISPSESNTSNQVTVREFNSVCEVIGECPNICEALQQNVDLISDLAVDTTQEFHISKSKKNNTFFIACLLQDSESSSGLQEDMKTVLTKIELLLINMNCAWEDVLYIHLYISNMDEFAQANEAYVKFISQEKCRYGVPSRSTIELPLLQVGLGRACIEVLVSNDSTKKVLHVQSISCWAPSCIGPYSQATLHQDVLYMAGQLGLDPPTMLLKTEGPAFELKQALENSEAVALCFGCSVSFSALSLIIYCSITLSSSDRIAIENQMNQFLLQMKLKLDNRTRSNLHIVDDPIILYILVPDLPKRASVEVKPMLYTGVTSKFPINDGKPDSFTRKVYWGFQRENWHADCYQQCIVSGRICTTTISITNEVVSYICSRPTGQVDDDMQSKMVTEQHLVKIAEFCIFLLDEVLLENDFSWDDVLTLRVYFTASLHVLHGKLSTIFSHAFDEFARMTGTVEADKEPIFNLVPVLGVGRSATSMNDLLTCELYARK